LDRSRPRDIASGIMSIGVKYQEALPDVRILITGILPRDADRSLRKDKIDQVNSSLEKLCKHQDIENFYYIPPSDDFLKDNGEVEPEMYYHDLLHMNEKGNESLARSIHTVLKKLMTEDELSNDEKRLERVRRLKEEQRSRRSGGDSSGEWGTGSERLGSRKRRYDEENERSDSSSYRKRRRSSESDDRDNRRRSRSRDKRDSRSNHSSREDRDSHSRARKYPFEVQHSDGGRSPSTKRRRDSSPEEAPPLKMPRDDVAVPKEIGKASKWYEHDSRDKGDWDRILEEHRMTQTSKDDSRESFARKLEGGNRVGSFSEARLNAQELIVSNPPENTSESSVFSDSAAGEPGKLKDVLYGVSRR